MEFFFQFAPLVTLNNFTLDKYFVIIKLSCSKRRSRGQIGEILQNDVNKWRHKSKTGHDRGNFFFQNIFLVTLNNFTLDKYFVIIKLNCSKRRSRGQIGEILQNDVNKWRHKSKTGHHREKKFQNISLVTLSNFTLDKYFVIIKLTCSKRRSRGQIGEILQNEVNKWRHMSMALHGMKNFFCSKC